MTNSSLQHGYSEAHPAAIYGERGRANKARKTLAVLEDALGDLSDFALLDVGCGAGLGTKRFAERVRYAVGIDIDVKAVVHAAGEVSRDNLGYSRMDSQAMGLPDDCFDIVICNHVYEHVPDARRLMSEIRRVLKPGGVCYFGAGNRLCWNEPHYHLPLLSVVPRWAANRYLRLLRRGDYYYEKHLTLWGLRRLVADFERIDYSVSVVKHPEKFGASDVVQPGSMTQKVALRALRVAYWLCPTYIWLLRKR